MVTAQEITQIAFLRPIDSGLIKAVDIARSARKYVVRYVEGVDDDLYDLDEVKQVVANGVVFNIFERLATDITDRGLVKLSIEGVGMITESEKRALKRELYKNLILDIETMLDKAEEEGYTTVNTDEVNVNTVTRNSNNDVV